MAGELLAGLSAFKTAIDAASALREIKNEHDRALAVFDVVQKLSTLQNDYLQLAARHQELSDENRSLKDWANEKEKYELFSPSTGTFAYRAKEAERGAEPQHSLCANCYENGKKSILQAEDQDYGRRTVLVCTRCGADIVVRGERAEPVQPRRR